MKRRRTLIALALLPIVLALAACGGHKKAAENDQEPLRTQHVTRMLALGRPLGRRSFASVLGLQSATGRCGVELWAFKTMTDLGAGSVDLTPTAATLADLTSSAKYPIGDPSRTARSSPIETHVWRVQTTLKGYKLESDSDIHLQLDGAIGELGDPGCASGSRVLAQMAQARSAFLAKFTLGGECFDCLSVPVTIDGVGFFDHPHGQHGAAGNQFELHPIIRISFGTGPPPPPPPTTSTVATTTAPTTTASTTTSPTTSTTPTPSCHDRDRKADKVEFPHWIPGSDPDLRDDIHERRAHIC